MSVIKFQSASECVRYFYNSYLIERDYQSLDKILEEKSSFFGTKLLEVASCYEDTVDILNNATKNPEAEFKAQELWLAETALCQEIFLVNGEIELVSNVTAEIEFAGRNRIRLTAICKKIADTIKITHFHLSVPEQGLVGEFLHPFAELLKKNKQLEDILLMQTQALEKQAQLDTMTNILNRKAVVESLKNMTDAAKCKYKDIAVLILDIDDFKLINDSHGRDKGDAVILDLVALVQDNIRPSDVFGRYGGDEFMLILPNADCKQAKIVIERLKRVALNRNFKGYDGIVSVSIGCAHYEKGKDIETLIKEAETNLENDKKDRLYS